MQGMSGRLQAGVSLIEVLIALLVFSIGALGAALLQLNALKFTDSAMRSGLTSFIAADMFERIRANPDADYGLVSLDQAPTAGNLEVPRDQDLYDFARNVADHAGTDAGASISVAGKRVTINLTWDDTRAQGGDEPSQRFTFSSEIAP
jgi:type IV pilus assembly protein PilV